MHYGTHFVPCKARRSLLLLGPLIWHNSQRFETSLCMLLQHFFLRLFIYETCCCISCWRHDTQLCTKVGHAKKSFACHQLEENFPSSCQHSVMLHHLRTYNRCLHSTDLYTSLRRWSIVTPSCHHIAASALFHTPPLYTHLRIHKTLWKFQDHLITSFADVLTIVAVYYQRARLKLHLLQMALSWTLSPLNSVAPHALSSFSLSALASAHWIGLESLAGSSFAVGLIVEQCR